MKKVKCFPLYSFNTILKEKRKNLIFPGTKERGKPSKVPEHQLVPLLAHLNQKMCSINKVTRKVGGFENSRTVADLPHSYDQVSKIKRNKTEDEVMELVDICRGQHGTAGAFLRDVRTAPELSCFLSTDNQLNDIERFCTGSGTGILGIDPTFNICDYNVTLTTYQHPLLTTKNIVGSHPTFIGPVLIHSSKTAESYFTLPSNIVRFKSTLKNLNAFGTDGEINVFESFKNVFPGAKHLLCSIHFKDNIIDKCRSLGIQSETFLEDIFGKEIGSTKVTGLIDCFTPDEFMKKYETVRNRWCQKENGEAFSLYFDQFKVTPILTSFLASTREACGLGTPPTEYTQNGNESINAMVKRTKGTGKLGLKETIKLIREEVLKQEEKSKLALIGKGSSLLLDLFLFINHWYKNKLIWLMAPYW